MHCGRFAPPARQPASSTWCGRAHLKPLSNHAAWLYELSYAKARSLWAASTRQKVYLVRSRQGADAHPIVLDGNLPQQQEKPMPEKPTPSCDGDMNQSLGTAQKTAPGSTSEVNHDSQSVAGEEDPGASLDTFGHLPSRSTGAAVAMPSGSVNPGDEAPEGTSGTGEGICRQCGGSGRAGDSPCPSCKGSGKVTVGIGGA